MSKMLSNYAMFIWFFIISTPFLWSVGSKYEGQIFPVVSPVKIIDAKTTEYGTYVNVEFKKIRQCQFVGISWYDKFNIRRGVEFEPDANLSPITRPTGDQVAGPWLISKLEDTKGSRAIVTHRCHPFWLTYTAFYP